MNFITMAAHFIPPILVPLWGPYKIHAYGLFILCGLGTFFLLMRRDPWRAPLLSSDTLKELIVLGTVTGVVGGRLFYALFDEHTLTTAGDMLSFWKGGFSALGSMITVGLCMAIYVRAHGILMLRFLDLASFYAPLLHAIARLGCFFAGCCYGIPTTARWAVVYMNPDSCAPLYQKLHPTQLYSVMSFIALFLVMALVRKKIPYRPGLFVALYVLLSGFERFTIDFWRADRTFYVHLPLSIYQYIALGFMGSGFIALALLAIQSRRKPLEHI